MYVRYRAKIMPPITIIKMTEVVTPASLKVFSVVALVSLLFATTIKKAPKAPTAPAYVGTKKPV